MIIPWSPRRRRYARASRDRNHLPIQHAFEACGFATLDLSALGGGAPDLLVAKGERVWLFEFKNPDAEGRQPARVKPHQKAWHATWTGPPVHVVWTKEEAFAVVGIAL